MSKKQIFLSFLISVFSFIIWWLPAIIIGAAIIGVIIVIIIILLSVQFQIPFFLTKTKNIYNFPTISAQAGLTNKWYDEQKNKILSVKAEVPMLYNIINKKTHIITKHNYKKEVSNLYLYNDTTSNMFFYNDNFFQPLFTKYLYFPLKYLKNISPVIKEWQVYDDGDKNLKVYVDLKNKKVDTNMFVSNFNYFYNKTFNAYKSWNLPTIKLTLKIQWKTGYNLMKENNADVYYVTFPVKVIWFGSEIKDLNYLKENNNNNMKGSVLFYLKTEDIKQSLKNYVKNTINKQYNDYLTKYCSENKTGYNYNIFELLTKYDNLVSYNNLNYLKDLKNNYVCDSLKNDTKKLAIFIKKLGLTKTEEWKNVLVFNRMVWLLHNLDKIKTINTNDEKNKNQKHSFNTENPYYLIQDNNTIQLNPQLQLMSISLVERKWFNLSSDNVIIPKNQDYFSKKTPDKIFKPEKTTTFNNSTFADYLDYFKKDNKNNYNYNVLFKDLAEKIIEFAKEKNMPFFYVDDWTVYKRDLKLLSKKQQEDLIKTIQDLLLKNKDKIFPVIFNNYYLQNLNGYKTYLGNILGITYSKFLYKLDNGDKKMLLLDFQNNADKYYILKANWSLSPCNVFVSTFTSSKQKECSYLFWTTTWAMMLDRNYYFNAFWTKKPSNNVKDYFRNYDFIKSDFTQKDFKNIIGSYSSFNNISDNNAKIFYNYLYKTYADDNWKIIKFNEKDIDKIENFNESLTIVNNYFYLRKLYNKWFEQNETLTNYQLGIMLSNIKSFVPRETVNETKATKQIRKTLEDEIQKIKNQNNLTKKDWIFVLNLQYQVINWNAPKLKEYCDFESDKNRILNWKKLDKIEIPFNYNTNNFFFMPDYNSDFWNIFKYELSMIFWNWKEKNKSFYNFNTFVFNLNNINIEKDFVFLENWHRTPLEYVKYYTNKDLKADWEQVMKYLSYNNNSKEITQDKIQQNVQLEDYKKIVEGVVENMAIKSNILKEDLITYIDPNDVSKGIKKYNYCDKMIKNSSSKWYKKCLEFFNDYSVAENNNKKTAYYDFYIKHIRPLQISTLNFNIQGNVWKGIFRPTWKKDAKYCWNNNYYNGECVCLINVKYNFPYVKGRKPGGNAQDRCGSYQRYVDNGGEWRVITNSIEASQVVKPWDILVGAGWPYWHIWIIQKVESKNVIVWHFNWCWKHDPLYDVYDEIVLHKQRDFKEPWTPCQWVYKQRVLSRQTLNYSTHLKFKCLIQAPSKFLRK